MSNEIQQTRYDRLLRRVGGIIGPGSKVGEVLTELFPTLDVENGPGELLFLSGWQLGVGGGNITPAAGDRQKFQLVNPPGSGKIVVLTNLVVSTATATSVNMTVTDTLFVSAPGSQTNRDTRAGIGQTVAQVREESSPATTSPQYITQLGIREPFLLHDPNGICVLSPGFAWEVGINGTATNHTFGCMWRERDGEESELNF